MTGETVAPRELYYTSVGVERTLHGVTEEKQPAEIAYGW